MKSDEIKKLAKLARIKLTESEADIYTPQMGTILKSVDVLSTIDTNGVSEYLPHELDYSDLREDIPEQGLSRDEALKNAPFKDNQYIIVYGDVSEVEEA